MLRGRVFGWVLVSLVAAGVAISFLNSRPRSVRLVLAAGVPSPRRQEDRARRFRAEKFTELVSIPAGGSRPLKSPTAIRVALEGDLFVLDSGSRQIKKYSRLGAPMVAFAAADFQNPSDLAVAPDGGVWVADPNPRTLTEFDPRGAVRRRLVLDRLAWRLILAEPGGVVATVPSGTPTLFRPYSAAGVPGRPFGTLFPAEFQTALAMDGWMVDVGRGAFVYIFAHEGLLAAYSPDGRLRFLRATIEAPPLPEIQVDATSRQAIDHAVPWVSISGSLCERDLYILSLAADQRRILDVYDVESGSYRYSLEPPDREARAVVVTPDRLFSASRSRVTIWRRDPGRFPAPSPTVAVVPLSTKGDDS